MQQMAKIRLHLMATITTKWVQHERRANHLPRPLSPVTTHSYSGQGHFCYAKSYSV